MVTAMVWAKRMPSSDMTGAPVVLALAAIIGMLNAGVVLAQVAPVTGAPPAPGGATPIGTGANADQRNGVFYGIRAGWLISDNLNLQPASAPDKQHMLIEVAPYVQARMDNARGYAYANYTLRVQSREDSLNFSNYLQAVSDIKITDDLLRVTANATISQINANPFGVSSFDPGSQRTNSTAYRSFAVSPYMRGRFDGNGVWSARYQLNYVDTGALDAFGFSYPASTSQTAVILARSDLSKRALGASINATGYSTSYNNGLQYAGAEGDLLAWWAINRYNLRVAAGVGYSQNDRLRNSNGDNSGIGPSAAIDWAPDPRTFVRGRWAQRYYGESAELFASHRATNWLFSFTYGKGISDGIRSSTPGIALPGGVGLSPGFVAPGDQFGRSTANNPLAEGLASRNLLFGGATSLTTNTPNLSLGSNAFGGLGLIASAIVFYDTATATVGFVGARSAGTASVFYNSRRTALTFSSGIFDDIEQRGASLGASYRLDPVRSISASLRYTHSSSDSRASTSDLTAFVASWDWRFTPRSTFSVGGRLQRQTGTGTTADYNEAAVFVAANYRVE